MKGGQEILDLRDLTPEGTRLEFSEQYKWRAAPGAIYIGRFKGTDCLLAFLHEIGHLMKAEDADIIMPARRRSHGERFKDKNNAYPYSRLSALKEERRVVVASERSAWAQALLLARKLKREYGIDLIKQYGGRRGIMEFINGFLGKYEQGYLDELHDINIYTTEQMEDLFKRIDAIPEGNIILETPARPHDFHEGKLQTA